MDQLEKNLEADIQQLAAEIRDRREQSESRDVSEQEIIKEAIRAFPESKHESQQAGVPSPASNQADESSPLPAYAQSAPAETKLEIEYLLDVALKKGISQALSESRKSPAFVQDAFHDALAGRLYPELQKRGIVK
jgi:hypothetical protein